MTIHASKGLEFPVVIVPYCNWPLYRISDSWVNVKNEKVELPVTVVSLSKKVSDSGFEQELEVEKQDQVLDNLNLLYVAFTRAVERLHIISTTTHTVRQESVSDWMEDFVKNNYPANAEGLSQIGAPQAKQMKHSKASLGHFDLQPLDFSTSKNVIRIKASYLNNSETSEEAKQAGLLLHSLLAQIKEHKDSEKALEKAFMEGLVSKEELPILRNKINEVIQHPELAPYFKTGLRCKLEAELVTQNGELLRPDRIVFSDSETILIDYKTGKENTKAYSKQLYKYEAALLSMGYPRVKKLLVYVDEMKVVEVK